MFPTAACSRCGGTKRTSWATKNGYQYFAGNGSGRRCARSAGAEATCRTAQWVAEQPSAALVRVGDLIVGDIYHRNRGSDGPRS